MDLLTPVCLLVHSVIIFIIIEIEHYTLFAYQGQTIPPSKLWGIDNWGIGGYSLPPS